MDQALSPLQASRLLSSLRPQVMPPSGHAYAFGEPGRIGRAVAYAVARGDIGQAQVDTWFSGLVEDLGPRPQAGAEADWWRRRSNLQAFLNALGYMLEGETQAPLVALAASVRDTMRRLP